MSSRARHNRLPARLSILFPLLAVGALHGSAAAEPTAASMVGARRTVERLATRVEAELGGSTIADTQRPGGRREVAGGSAVPFDLVGHTREFYRELTNDTGDSSGGGTLAIEATLAQSERDAQLGPATVTAEGAPVRAAPGATAGVLALADEGATVDVLAGSGSWRKALLDSGAVGWVAAEHLGPEQTLEEKLGAEIVRQAMEYMGVPYVHGGQSRAGMDCSGLVFSVMRSIGKRVPRTAATLYGVGTAVTREGLRAGDLVFFTGGSKPGISHVGIYAGDRSIVHASSGIGSVGISSLDSPYYRRYYAGARRVLP